MSAASSGLRASGVDRRISPVELDERSEQVVGKVDVVAPGGADHDLEVSRVCGDYDGAFHAPATLPCGAERRLFSKDFGQRERDGFDGRELGRRRRSPEDVLVDGDDPRVRLGFGYLPPVRRDLFSERVVQIGAAIEVEGEVRWHVHAFAALDGFGRGEEVVEVGGAREQEEPEALPQLPDDREHRVVDAEPVDPDREEALVVRDDLPRFRSVEARRGSKEGRHRVGVEAGREVGRPLGLGQTVAHLGERHVDFGGRLADDVDGGPSGAQHLGERGRSDADAIGGVSSSHHGALDGATQALARAREDLPRPAHLVAEDEPVRPQPEEHLRLERRPFAGHVRGESHEPAHPLDLCSLLPCSHRPPSRFVSRRSRTVSPRASAVPWLGDDGAKHSGREARGCRALVSSPRPAYLGPCPMNSRRIELEGT
jgi:hypothetical protein